MFKVGDKVVYPMHGAGIIESIEKREVLGDTRKYFVLRMPVGEMKLLVPVANVEDVGLRQVIDGDLVKQVLEVLKQKRCLSTDNWNRRYRSHLEKMKTGDVFAIAEVVRNLMTRERDKGLSTGERKMLDTASQILASELALAQNIEQATALELLARNME